jgi:hypothetical protein
LDFGRGPLSARAFDFAAPQADVGERAIVEPLERANVATTAPFEQQPVRQPGASPGENMQPPREPARRMARQRADNAAALTICPHLKFI